MVVSAETFKLTTSLDDLQKRYFMTYAEKNSKEPDDVGRSLGADVGSPTTKESRGGETTRPPEKG